MADLHLAVLAPALGLGNALKVVGAYDPFFEQSAFFLAADVESLAMSPGDAPIWSQFTFILNPDG